MGWYILLGYAAIVVAVASWYFCTTEGVRPLRLLQVAMLWPFMAVMILLLALSDRR